MSRQRRVLSEAKDLDAELYAYAMRSFASLRTRSCRKNTLVSPFGRFIFISRQELFNRNILLILLIVGDNHTSNFVGCHSHGISTGFLVRMLVRVSIKYARASTPCILQVSRTEYQMAATSAVLREWEP